MGFERFRTIMISFFLGNYKGNGMTENSKKKKTNALKFF